MDTIKDKVMYRVRMEADKRKKLQENIKSVKAVYKKNKVKADSGDIISKAVDYYTTSVIFREQENGNKD